VLRHLRPRWQRLRARVVGFPYDARICVIAMLLLTYFVPLAFVESHRASGVRDLALSLQRSGTPAVAYRTTVDIGQIGPKASSWTIDDVRVRLPGIAGEVWLVGTDYPGLGKHRNDEIGYARLKNLPAYQPPLRVRYLVTGTTVKAMAEPDMNREARTISPEVTFGLGLVGAVLWVLGWAVAALLVIDDRAGARSETPVEVPAAAAPPPSAVPAAAIPAAAVPATTSHEPSQGPPRRRRRTRRRRRRG
jgi:hypothetical protein